MIRNNSNNDEFFCLENDLISCTVIPSFGAKIISLFDKSSGREWLVPCMRKIEQVEFDAHFTEQSMGGWDEMLPTIDSCIWKGNSLPDHGETWQVPWKCSIKGNSIRTTLQCTIFPFRFSRTISFFSDDTFLLTYDLINEGHEELPWLWAAHPQFYMNLNTRIIFPKEITQMVNVIDNDPVFGSAGTIVDYPSGKDGNSHNLDVVHISGSPSCRKFYCLPETHIAQAGLVDNENNCSLLFRWDSDVIPYCGLWVDEGAYHSKPVAAIEPSSAYYDSLPIAEKNKRLPFLSPSESVSWNLYLQMT